MKENNYKIYKTHVIGLNNKRSCPNGILLPRILPKTLNDSSGLFHLCHTMSFNKYCIMMMFDIFIKANFIVREFVKTASPERSRGIP